MKRLYIFYFMLLCTLATSCRNTTIPDPEFEQRNVFDAAGFSEHYNHNDIFMCKHFMRGDSMLVKMHLYPGHFHEYRYYKYQGKPVYEVFTFYEETNKIHSKLRMHGEYLFPMGKEYFFDEKGKVETIINHEEPFSFTLEDVYRFIGTQPLSLHKIKRYSVNTDRPYWYVTFEDPADPEKALAFYLDGQTGKVFKEYEPVKRTKKLEHPLPFMFTDKSF